MTSIPQVSRQMKKLLEQDALELGKQAGMRERGIRFAQLAWLLVLGWWAHPDAGPSRLARFAGELGLSLCKQEVACHFTERTATWLLALLRRGVQYVVCAGPIDLPLLQQFSAVLIEDGSTITLPSCLKTVWGGCGGRKRKEDEEASSAAGLKITVRWDLLKGRLCGSLSARSPSS